MTGASASGGAPVERRIVFQGLGALGAAAALAGCGGGEDDGGGDGEGGSNGRASGTELATTGEVPVGGGLILSGEKVVLTQPTEGEFKAFSTACTHQGCPVTGVSDTIDCTCHGSRFDLGTGEPVAGPAPSALEEVPITVDGDRIVTA